MKYDSASNGWLARYTREKVTFSKLFSDSIYGSAEAAFEAAKAWHTQARSLLPPINRREYMEQLRGNNTSGRTGVYRHSQVVKGHTYESWIAAWTGEGGKRIRKQFYIHHHGEEEAKRLAIAHRATVIETLPSEWGEGYWSYRPREVSEAFQRDIFGFEGKEMFSLHIAKERDQNLRMAKIEAFLSLHGSLFCEICGFDYERTYGTLGRGLIEVHHLVPICELTSQTKMYLDDLMLTCSNCHLVLHNGDCHEVLKSLRFIFDAKKTITHTKASQITGTGAV